MEKRINNAKVTVADLLKATSEVHKLPPEDRNWEGRLHTMAQVFQGNPDKALAIERLVAMSRMLESGSLPGWAMPKAANGSVSVAEAVWLAASEKNQNLKRQAS